MRTTSIRLGVFALLGLASSCSSLHVVQPTGMMDTPERVTGDGKSGIDFSTVPGFDYTTTIDASSRPFAWRPTVEESGTLFGRARLPLETAPLEFGLGIYLTGLMAQVKAQLLGPAEIDAVAEDVSLAVLLQGTTSGSFSKDGDHNGEFGPGGFPWKGKIASYQMATSILAGYRVADELLVYVGPYYSTAYIRSSVEQTVVGGTGGNYRMTDHVRRIGPVVGVEFRLVKHFSVLGEFMRLRSMSSTASDLGATNSINLAARFTLGD